MLRNVSQLCKQSMIMLNQQFNGFLLMWQFLYGHETIGVRGAHQTWGEHHRKILAVHSVLTLQQLHSMTQDIPSPMGQCRARGRS